MLCLVFYFCYLLIGFQVTLPSEIYCCKVLCLYLPAKAFLPDMFRIIYIIDLLFLDFAIPYLI